jgi:hypothetical protein
MSVPKICMAMITKNAAATIEACLASFRHAVDYIVVYDTPARPMTPSRCSRG